ncbi:MAG: hypothetical protein ACLTDC_05860 [Lachnospiraceae bacterium]
MKTMHSILDSGLLLPDPLPADIRRQYQLSEYNYALRQIHFPENEEACRMARKRLVFDEFLVFALSVKQLKKRKSSDRESLSDSGIGGSFSADRIIAVSSDKGAAEGLA